MEADSAKLPMPQLCCRHRRDAHRGSVLERQRKALYGDLLELIDRTPRETEAHRRRLYEAEERKEREPCDRALPYGPRTIRHGKTVSHVLRGKDVFNVQVLRPARPQARHVPRVDDLHIRGS